MFEQMFEHGGMVDQAATVAALRERVDRMQGRSGGHPVATHPVFAGLLSLQAGGVYGADSASVVMALLAGPSGEGQWCAVVGSTDLGLEAAAAAGVELSRTILVPEPGAAWLEVTAALIDVVGVVVVRPPEPVGQRDASRIAARLRTRQCILVAWGDWPRCDARVGVVEARWTGVGRGHGHLRARRATIEVRRGAAPARTREVWLPDADLVIRRADPVVAPAMRVVS